MIHFENLIFPLQRKGRLLYFISTILTNIDTILAFFILFKISTLHSVTFNEKNARQFLLKI